MADREVAEQAPQASVAAAGGEVGTERAPTPLGGMSPALLQRKLARRRAQRGAVSGAAAGGVAADEGGVGESGARPLEAGMRAQAEKSLGVDLGGVRVHEGPEAAASASAVGAQAFAHGQDIVLGQNAKNDLNPVLAHEVTHTVQQRDAAPGIAMKPERGSSGSAHEVEADSVATRIMLGAPATVTRTGAEQVMCFEGAEHMKIGNQAWGGRQVTVGNVTLPAGAFTALQGDFFGSWKELRTACADQPKLIYDYYDVLLREGKLRDLHERGQGPEPDSDGPIMVASVKNGRRLTAYTDLAATNFAHFSEQNAEGDKLYGKALDAAPAYASEIAEAQVKFGHNVGQWLEMHLIAAQAAFDDGVGNRAMSGEQVAMDAAACHYLTDAFAAGHMRVPRLQMHDEYQAVFSAAARMEGAKMIAGIPEEIDLTALGLYTAAGPAGTWVSSHLPPAAHAKVSTAALKAAVRASVDAGMDKVGKAIGEVVAGFSAKVLHDFDNENGLTVHNDAGQTWTATGDHNLDASKENEKLAVQCTAASSAHLIAMNNAGREKAGVRDGKPPAMPFLSLRPVTRLIPQLDPKVRDEGTEPGGPRDWHWKTMSADYRRKVKENAAKSATGTVSSALEGIAYEMRKAVRAEIQKALGGKEDAAGPGADRIDGIVEKVISSILFLNSPLLIESIFTSATMTH